MKILILISIILASFKTAANETIGSLVNQPVNFNGATFLELVTEIESLKKPVKDPWMKEAEYQRILNEFQSNTKKLIRVFKISMDEISVPCGNYDTFCYDVEDENLYVFLDGYKDFEIIYNENTKTSNEEGQTILQKNFDRSTEFTKFEKYQDRLILKDSKDRKFSIPIPINDIKGKSELYNAYVVFSVDLFEDFDLNYKRIFYTEASIDTASQFITYSRDIHGSYLGISFYKDNELIATTIKQSDYDHLFRKRNSDTFDEVFMSPINRPIPIYPRKAVSKRIIGSSVVEFTILKNGSVKNVKSVKGSGLCATELDRYSRLKDPYECELFNKTTERAAHKLLFPKQKIELQNMRHKFTYILE